MILAYKFLSGGAVGLHSGFRWPRPTATAPGAWVEADGPVDVGATGVHACAATELVDWIDDELWVTELDGTVERHDGVLVAQRGRLVRPVVEWDAGAAWAFAASCVVRLCDAALVPGPPSGVFAHVADAALLACGGRPDRRGDLPTAATAPTAGAVAANLGFVSAHAAGCAEAAASGDPRAYDAGFENERQRQRDWLEGRLGLRELLPRL